jgi:hypothetical protein
MAAISELEEAINKANPTSWAAIKPGSKPGAKLKNKLKSVTTGTALSQLPALQAPNSQNL